MIDFTKLSHEDGSFVPDDRSWMAYKTWLIKEAECRHCGAKYRDRPECYGLGHGRSWLTETNCGCEFKKVKDEVDAPAVCSIRPTLCQLPDGHVGDCLTTRAGLDKLSEVE